jgi:hypothetical protein
MITIDINSNSQIMEAIHESLSKHIATERDNTALGTFRLIQSVTISRNGEI